MNGKKVNLWKGALIAASLGLFTFGAPQTASATTCTCSGTAIDGPFTVSCGTTVCGTDGHQYTCSSQDAFTGPGAACTCWGTCSGTGINGPYSNIACGSSICG